LTHARARVSLGPVIRRAPAVLAVLLLALALAGTARAAVDVPPGAPVTLPEHFEDVTLGEGFFVPTAMAFAPGGRTFVAQLWGRVSVIQDGKVEELLDIGDHVNIHGDRGLIGMAVDADFATNGHLYLLYVYEPGPDPSAAGPKAARLTRVVVNPDNTVANPASPETVILGKEGAEPCGAPSNELDCMASSAPTHTVGTVRADPDGTLWVGMGDGADAVPNDERALRTYDERAYNGKLLHIDGAGNGLPGHPFCPDDTDLTHVCTKVYAKGFRNPYRFALRPGGAGPVVGDVGFNSHEEIDLAEPGGNYGWPCWEGPGPTPGWDSNVACDPFYAPGAVDEPAWTYGNGPGASIVGGPPYPASGPFPAAFDGDYLVGDYAQGWIKRLELGSEPPVVKEFAGGAGPLDLQVTPAGNVAYAAAEGLSFDGRVAEIRHCPVNCGPVARFSVDRIFGDAPLAVKFDASKSFDWDDGDTLTYDWDFGDGSAHSTAKSPAHTYADDGLFTATLTVSDGERSAERSVKIWSANTPPVPKIEAPADGSAFRIGTPVQLKGSATDREDGAVADLSWTVMLRHNRHLHPFDSGVGATADFSPAPDHDSGSWYEVTLTARDSQGLKGTRTIRLWPSTVPVRLGSVPSGAPLTWAGTAVVAPFATFSPLGFKTFVSAAPSFTRGKRTYAFDGWSDGKAAGHAVTVAGPGLSLVARYRDVTVPDTTGPRLRFDPKRAGKSARRGWLAGRASDPAGVRRVHVALRARRASKQGCRWWLRRHGRLGGGRSSCEHPRWIRAKLEPRTGGVRWRAGLGGDAPPRRYVVEIRAIDALGNVTRRVNGSKRVRISVPR
jgi:glucose/arabinose dehydrogenase